MTLMSRFLTTAFSPKRGSGSACRSSKPSLPRQLISAGRPAWSTARQPSSIRPTCEPTHRCRRSSPALVITAAVVTPGETADEHVLGELLRQNRRRLGSLPEEVVADARYGTKAIYRGLEERGIHAVIPDRVGPKLHPGGVWTIREFKYD